MDSSFDRIKGMFLGAWLGDALGAPHEFRCNAGISYTGRLEYQAFMIARFQGRKELAVGQVTDDTEMMLALLRTLIKDGTYHRDHVVHAYLKWAQSGGWMMGRNTRALLKGVKTIPGYERRMHKSMDAPMDSWSQSNGFLMRSAPLALLHDDLCIQLDASITNPHPICIDVNRVYIHALREALRGEHKLKILSGLIDIAQTETVKEIITTSQNLEERDVSISKGWCLHALWITFSAAYRFETYADAMMWIIGGHPGSDTDTNACIAGAFLGALYGYHQLEADPTTSGNIHCLLTCESSTGPTPRPLEYQPFDAQDIILAAHALYRSHYQII